MTMRARTAAGLCCGLVALAGLVLVACESKREIKQGNVPQAMLRDVPDVLRGTVGAEATIRGIEPVLVSGLGLVVGLNGTGGGELPVQVQATMERELAKGGIGKGGAGANTDLGPVSPQEFLRSPNVAVVIVQAAIAPGAPHGSVFDVFVRTLPGSSVTSLEGGTLWTTDLRFGEPAVFGAIKTRKLGEARGPVFINPFSGVTSRGGSAQITRTLGRVMGGGVVTEPLAMEMLLDNESHARARSVVSAINSRFPGGAGDDAQIARGRGRSGAQQGASQSIALTVPSAYKDRAAEFIQLVRHLRIDQGFQQEYAKLYVEEMKNRPGMAEELSWCVQAIGKPSLPFLAPLYDYPEVGPRFAALSAGARLGDHRVVTPLANLAKTGPLGVRAQAIRLLGKMPANPSVNLTLSELVAEKDLDVRVAAYEGLRERGDASIVSVPVGVGAGGRDTARFMLDLVPGGEPLVYVTQQGQARLVLFGADEAMSGKGERRPGKVSGLTLNKPLTFGAWEDRLLLAADSSTDGVRLRFLPSAGGRAVQLAKAPEDLAELVQYFAQRSTPENPEPGLNMTYSDVVGVVYEMTRQGALSAAFATEEDRLRAEVFEASQTTALVDRPETSEGAGPAETVQVFKSLDAPSGAGGAGGGEAESSKVPEKLTRVVPLTPGKGKGKSKKSGE